MTERPIIFNSEMVRAILDGRKTQTRRVVKPQPVTEKRATYWGVDKNGMTIFGKFVMSNDAKSFAEMMKYNCPYGQPGDHLWVRETFGINHRGDSTPGGNPYDPEVVFRADDDQYNPVGPQWDPFKWKPSIHMPRWASRITLEITGVRVERVQDISDVDALAEGIESNWDEGVTYYGPLNQGHADPRVAFMWLWNSINAKRGYGWNQNPWVWVVEFRRVTP